MPSQIAGNAGRLADDPSTHMRVEPILPPFTTPLIAAADAANAEAALPWLPLAALTADCVRVGVAGGFGAAAGAAPDGPEGWPGPEFPPFWGA